MENETWQKVMKFGFLAHLACRPKMSLCHCVVCPQFTRNNSPSILIRFQFCLVYLKELVPVH